jgi:hypothetical protein
MESPLSASTECVNAQSVLILSGRPLPATRSRLSAPPQHASGSMRQDPGNSERTLYTTKVVLCPPPLTPNLCAREVDARCEEVILRIATGADSIE